MTHYSKEKDTKVKLTRVTPSQRFQFKQLQEQLETIILSEVSQKEKDKYHMILLLCGI